MLGEKKMERGILYAQLDIERLKEIEKKANEKLSFIEQLFNNIKYFTAEHLPHPLSDLVLGGIGDILVIFVSLVIIATILKIFGVAFKIVWRIFIFSLLVGSIYVLYKNFFN